MRTKEMASVVKSKIEASPSGISAKFVALNDKWGVKLFHEEETRDVSYELQKRAASWDLAPKVGGVLDLPKSDTTCLRRRRYEETYCFGFITQIVEVVGDILRKRDGIVCVTDGVYQTADGKDVSIMRMYELFREWLKEGDNKQEIEDVTEQYSHLLGWSFYDDHYDNWGVLPDGSFVCIDFGGNS